MKAVILSNNVLVVQEFETPQQAEPGHIIIKMNASTINSGDKFFLRFPPRPGMVVSRYGIKGVSGAGKVLAAGDGVPSAYLDKQVAFYRQLKYSESVVGAWSEYAQIHYLDCVILPDAANPEDYSGSVVNIITPYAFLKQVIAEGHKGIISTAGNSATGIALLAFCQNYNFPLISIVRNEHGKKELEILGAKNIIVQSDSNFDEQLHIKAQELSTTAIFDGTGGETLTKVLTLVPDSSTIYSYGYVGDAVPISLHTSLLAVKNITVKPFSNLATETVRNPETLEKAMQEISSLIHLPHFKTKIGKRFQLDEINEAIAYQGKNGGKALLKLY